MNITIKDICKLYKEKHDEVDFHRITVLISRSPLVPTKYTVIAHKRTPMYSTAEIVAVLEKHRTKNSVKEKTKKLCDEIVELLKEAKWAK